MQKHKKLRSRVTFFHVLSNLSCFLHCKCERPLYKQKNTKNQQPPILGILIQVTPRGIEPLIPAWEASVLTAWPGSHLISYLPIIANKYKTGKYFLHIFSIFLSEYHACISLDKNEQHDHRKHKRKIESYSPVFRHFQAFSRIGFLNKVVPSPAISGHAEQ